MLSIAHARKAYLTHDYSARSVRWGNRHLEFRAALLSILRAPVYVSRKSDEYQVVLSTADMWSLLWISCLNCAVDNGRIENVFTPNHPIFILFVRCKQCKHHARCSSSSLLSDILRILSSLRLQTTI